MTDRDTFAAAALTGLCSMPPMSGPDKPHDFAAMAYAYADAMLRERERTNHDAAPAARASLPTADHAVCRGRESGCGTGDTDHGAAPAARASDGRPRTDKADLPTRAGTGDTPTVGAIATCDTLATQTTPGECSTPSEGTSEPVAWAVVDDRGLQYALHPTPGHASHMARTASVGLAEVVPLYRQPQPTLTDAEREAVEYYIGTGGPERVDATLRGLLERTK